MQVFFRIRYVPEEDGRVPRTTDVGVDTGGRGAPDRLIRLALEVEPRFTVYRSTGFGQAGGPTCRLQDVQHAAEPGLMTFEVPRVCLGNPDRLRVNLRTYGETANHDFAPDFRTFGSWVRRGAA